MSIKTIADKIMKGIYSQGWTVIGYGGSWAGACKPLETYIEKRVAKAVRAERERIIAANAPEIERINAHIKELEQARLEEREACARLVEPSDEHRRDAAWGYLGGEEGVEMLDGIAAAIRARGNK